MEESGLEALIEKYQGHRIYTPERLRGWSVWWPQNIPIDEVTRLTNELPGESIDRDSIAYHVNNVGFRRANSGVKQYTKIEQESPEDLAAAWPTLMVEKEIRDYATRNSKPAGQHIAIDDVLLSVNKFRDSFNLPPILMVEGEAFSVSQARLVRARHSEQRSRAA